MADITTGVWCVAVRTVCFWCARVLFIRMFPFLRWMSQDSDSCCCGWEQGFPLHSGKPPSPRFLSLLWNWCFEAHLSVSCLPFLVNCMDARVGWPVPALWAELTVCISSPFALHTAKSNSCGLTPVCAFPKTCCGWVSFWFSFFLVSNVDFFLLQCSK